ncbi:MAG TPA: hypothetical protein ENJ95_08530 [Bacteroidetes bacterium]|nr:hypothetical protein [Bacteroidota bacterium]
MKLTLINIILLSSFHLFGQNPIPLQVSVPIYFEDVEFPHLQSEDLRPVSHLTGIALLFLDTTISTEQIHVAGMDEPIIWADKVGITSKVSFMISDSISLMSLDLLYANGACTANIVKNEKTIATGGVTKDNSAYAIRLVGKEIMTDDIKYLIKKLNNFLMRLHAKKQKTIPVSPLFNRDSLNVILGPDLSFDTNYDLYWFDEILRNRLKNIAIRSYMKLKEDKGPAMIKDTIKSYALVFHTAAPSPTDDNYIEGRLSTIFKIKGGKDYLFLHADTDYLMEMHYKYTKWPTGSGRLMIDKFSIKNTENDDFVEMQVFDYTWNGIPLLYVDLISGVVMEDKGAWKADQFITAIQDIFRLVKFPYEG